MVAKFNNFFGFYLLEEFTGNKFPEQISLQWFLCSSSGIVLSEVLAVLALFENASGFVLYFKIMFEIWVSISLSKMGCPIETFGIECMGRFLPAYHNNLRIYNGKIDFFPLEDRVLSIQPN